jgi:hypothetical protein
MWTATPRNFVMTWSFFYDAIKNTRCRSNAIVLLALLMLASGNLIAGPACASPQDLRSLIDQLDDNDFQRRESAQSQIVALGDAAIVPLAKRLSSCSPETCSRIKRAMYQIAENCNEDSLFKILSILKVRFEIPDQQIQPLLTRWAVMGRKAVIQRWRDSGATVVDPNERMVDQGLVGQPFVPGGRPMALNGIQVFRGGQQIPQMQFRVNPLAESQQANEALGNQAKNDEADADVPRPPEAISMPERIDVVLANSTQQNIDDVLGEEEKGQSFKSALAIIQSFPVQVSLDANWQGDVTDFSRRSDARTLPISNITFDSLTLDSAWAKVLRWHPIEVCMISNCSIADDVSIQSPLLPPSVSTLTIGKSNNPGELIRALLPKKSKVYRFGLVDSVLDSETFQAIQGLNIMSLELENMDLDERDFSSLEDLPRLRQLTLSRCRFAAKSFRDFESGLQGRVRLDFTAKAFLGVRGNTAPIMFGPNLELNRAGGGREKIGCLITEVVSGAAADDAGVQAGDIILKIGDQQVDDFSDLRILIAQYGIGDQIVIRVRRAEKEIELKTTLGDFKDADNN